MKINRLLASAAIAALVVAAIGFVTAQSHAQTGTLPAQTSGDAQDKQKAVSGPDTDIVEEQVDDQNTANVDAEAKDGVNSANEQDGGPTDQAPLVTGRITVTETATQGLGEADESTTLASQAKITIGQAKAAVLATYPGTTVVKAELDNENGALVYSVELSTGADVKVNASNGAILHTDTNADSGEVKDSPDTDNVQEGQGQQVEDGQPEVPDAAPQNSAK